MYSETVNLVRRQNLLDYWKSRLNMEVITHDQTITGIYDFLTSRDIFAHGTKLFNLVSNFVNFRGRPTTIKTRLQLDNKVVNIMTFKFHEFKSIHGQTVQIAAWSMFISQRYAVYKSIDNVKYK